MATQDGVVIPPPMHPKSMNDARLPTWSGTPLEKQNIGATLKQGTVFCRVADPGNYEAVLYVDQSDIDQLRINEKVKIMLDQLPGVVFQTTVQEKSTDPVKYTPKALSNKSGGTVETKSDESGASRPASVLYQAICATRPKRVGDRHQRQPQRCRRSAGRRLERPGKNRRSLAFPRLAHLALLAADVPF